MNTKPQKWRNLSVSLNSVIRNGVIVDQRLLHDGSDTVEELLDRHVVKKGKSLDDEQEELLNQRRLSSTRREALHLYGDIIRATWFFTSLDSRGVMWRDILRETARKEFEEARFEKDLEIVTRLLIDERVAVESALERLAEKHRQQIEKERGCGGDRS